MLTLLLLSPGLLALHVRPEQLHTASDGRNMFSDVTGGVFATTGAGGGREEDRGENRRSPANKSTVDSNRIH